MKKAVLIGKSIIVLTLIFSLGFTSCKKQWWGDEEGNGGGSNGGGNPNNTAIKGTMVRISCGASIYDNLWIQTDDGKLLQPCAQSFQTLCPILLHEGDRVDFKYRPFSGFSYIDSMYICNMVLPACKRVIIDFINATNSCTPIKITPAFNTPKSDNVTILGAQKNGTCLQLKMGFGGCNENTKRFQLITTGKLLSSYGPPVYAAKIIDTDPQDCKAYFERETGYDISVLTANKKQTVYLKLEGYSPLIALN
ncbi:MAG: hypothetical protein V4538_13430 [Bacteroidota bacterium]